MHHLRFSGWGPSPGREHPGGGSSLHWGCKENSVFAGWDVALGPVGVELCRQVGAQHRSLWASVGSAGWSAVEITDLGPTAPGEGQREREREGLGRDPRGPFTRQGWKKWAPGSKAERPQEEGRQVSSDHSQGNEGRVSRRRKRFPGSDVREELTGGICFEELTFSLPARAKCHLRSRQGCAGTLPPCTEV